MNQGLEGVVVAETRLSRVDGIKGELVIAGLTLGQLTGYSFEKVVERLLGGSSMLGEARVRAFEHLSPVLPLLEGRKPLNGLRLALASLPSGLEAIDLVAAFPLMVAATRHGRKLQAPDPGLGQVEDFLRLFFRKEPTVEAIRALTTYFVSVCEHGMNASTFATRVVASTGADRVQATLAGLAALSGPLHGGAPGPVLDLLDELNQSGDLKAALTHKVQNGQRLMGFGHRIYRARDPRAEVLKSAVLSLSHSQSLGQAEDVEKAALEVLAQIKPDRPLKTNVEFYTAILLRELGFDREIFTPLFAVGRSIGWMAHYQEQADTGRLIRPESRYIGPEPYFEKSLSL